MISEKDHATVRQQIRSALAEWVAPRATMMKVADRARDDTLIERLAEIVVTERLRLSIRGPSLDDFISKEARLARGLLLRAGSHLCLLPLTRAEVFLRALLRFVDWLELTGRDRRDREAEEVAEEAAAFKRLLDSGLSEEAARATLEPLVQMRLQMKRERDPRFQLSKDREHFLGNVLTALLGPPEVWPVPTGRVAMVFAEVLCRVMGYTFPQDRNERRQLVARVRASVGQKAMEYLSSSAQN